MNIIDNPDIDYSCPDDASQLLSLDLAFTEIVDRMNRGQMQLDIGLRWLIERISYYPLTQSGIETIHDLLIEQNRRNDMSPEDQTMVEKVYDILEGKTLTSDFEVHRGIESKTIKRPSPTFERSRQRYNDAL
jgi:hypothetical protein